MSLSRRHKPIIAGIVFGICLLVGLTVGVPKPVAALSGADFNPGRIIDDALFFSPNSLSVEQIQNFLNAKVPSCDTNGTSASSHYNGSAGRYYSRAEWGSLNGNPAPYTCVRDLHLNVPQLAADNYCKAINAASGQSAAQVIYQVSQACSINPTVLIVLLQKEQGLITDDWPWTSQYDAATGYGCPDSADVCDAQYKGFFNQVYRAGRQFQMYAKLPTSYSFRGNGSFNVLYNPNQSCGGRTVTIQNQATADLYNYTPYVPNAAALNNLQGTGDSCSAYGNRNFWVYYNNWFGSPTTGGDSSQAELQHRVKTVATNTSKYTFYYDAYQQVLRLTTEDIASGTQTSAILDGSNAAGGGRINANVGSSLDAIVYNGYLQVYYYDATNGLLRHAWTDAGGWHFENLDGDSASVSTVAGDFGINPSVTLFNGRLQLFYYDRGNGNLRHAFISDSGWQFEVMDGDVSALSHRAGNTGMSSTVMQYGDFLQLYYYDSDAGNLRHAWTDSQGWHFENLDGDAGSISHYSANLGLSPTVVNYHGFIQLYYYDMDNGNLRHAWTDGAGWHFEDLDGNSAMVSRFSANLGLNPVVTLYNGELQLYYYDKSNTNLRHAWHDNGGWHFENLDGDPGAVASNVSDVGLSISAYTTDSSVQVYYFNRSAGTIKHAWVSPRGWLFENMAPSVVY